MDISGNTGLKVWGQLDLVSRLITWMTGFIHGIWSVM